MRCVCVWLQLSSIAIEQSSSALAALRRRRRRRKGNEQRMQGTKMPDATVAKKNIVGPTRRGCGSRADMDMLWVPLCSHNPNSLRLRSMSGEGYLSSQKRRTVAILANDVAAHPIAIKDVA